MSETLRDLVVSLSLNSDNFTRNIKSIQKQIAEAESAFKLASAGVDNFEHTTAGLTTRLSTLQRTLSLQKDAVEQYVKALSQASNKLQECYDRQNDYAQRLVDAKDKQTQLKTEVANAAATFKHYKTTLGETDSATIAAKGNLDLVKEEYRQQVVEVRRLEGQNVAVRKTTQNAADAFSQMATKLNSAKAAYRETASEIDKTKQALALSQTQWDAAGQTIIRSEQTITSIGKSIKTAESRFRLAAAGVKNFDASAAGMTAKLTLLQEKLVLQEAAVTQYEQALAAAREQLAAAQAVNDPDKIRQASDAIVDAETALNNARAALKQTEADIKDTNKALATARSAWTAVGNSLEGVGKHCTEAGKKLEKAGKTLTRCMTTPIVALGAASIKASIDFESSFASVRKTVDATEQEFDSLAAASKRMSTQIAASTNEINAVMATGGQLGIANEHLTEFTRVMIDLGNSCEDLDANEAAASIAKFANVMRTDQSMFSNIGSTIVDLGNNFATTEKPIMEMAQRLAGAGKQVGLTEAQVLGFATALSSVGIEAQMGGSAFSKALIKMEVACATGGDALDDFAQVCGMSASKFKALFDSDPAAAFRAFILGLAQLDEEGESAIAVLDDIGIKEVRLRDTMLRAVNATELFSRTQATANKAWAQNTALTIEANKRYATTESKLINLKNTAVLFAQKIGDDLNPTIQKLIEGANGMLEKFLSLDEAQRMQIIKYAAIAAAAGPVMLTLGKVSKVVGSVSTALGKFALAVGKAGGGFKGFMTVLAKSPAVWLAVDAAVVYGANKLSDYVSGAKAVREALEGMNATAQRWKETAAETFYGRSGLAFFGMSEADFTRDGKSSKGWVDGLLSAWSDNKVETKETVEEWTNSFKTLTGSTRDALIELKATADKAGYDGVSEQLQTDIEQLNAMDEEIEKLLKKSRSRYLTSKEKVRLEELINTRDALEIKYHLTPADTGGFDTIAQKVEAEIARARAKGQDDADVSVYENALVATAEGMAAINAQLDAEYDKQYALIRLMADGTEAERAAKENAQALLDTKYVEDRLSAAREYAKAMSDVILPVWNQKDIQAAGDAIDTLYGKLREYDLAVSSGDTSKIAKVLEDMNAMASSLDESSLTEYYAMLTQIQSLMDTGLSSEEIDSFFPDFDVSTQMQQIAALSKFVSERDGALEGLNGIFSEALPEEVLRIATDLDMTGAQARWDEFASNPGAITTEAIVGSYTEGENAVRVQPIVSAFISGYTEVEGGADTASLTPTGLLAYVTKYAEIVTGTDVSGLTPTDITALVGAYRELSNGADVSLLTPSQITAYISDYMQAHDVDTSRLTPDGITAFVLAYEEVQSGASTSGLTADGLTAYVSRYAEENGIADVSGLIPQNVTALVSAYRELESGADISKLTPSAITAYISKYLESNGCDVSELSPSGITAFVGAYQEINGGASTTKHMPSDIAAIVTEYLEANEVDISKLSEPQLDALISAYAEAANCDKSALKAEITARIIAYEDAKGVIKPTLQIGITGYDLAAYTQFVKDNPVKLNGIVRLGEVYDDPDDVLKDPKAVYWENGKEVPVNLVPANKIDAATLMAYDADGTLHVLLTPTISGTPEAVEEITFEIDAKDRERSLATRLGFQDYRESLMDDVRNLTNYLANTPTDGWLAKLSTRDAKGEVAARLQASDRAALQTFIGEVTAALNAGEEIPENAIANLQAISKLIQQLDRHGAGEEFIAGIAQVMTDGGLDTSTESVVENLEYALQLATAVDETQAAITAACIESAEYIRIARTATNAETMLLYTNAAKAVAAYAEALLAGVPLDNAQQLVASAEDLPTLLSELYKAIDEVQGSHIEAGDLSGDIKWMETFIDTFGADPIKMFMLGGDAGAGIGEGLADYDFSTDAEASAASMENALRTAYDSHSPAGLTMPIGNDAAAGIGVGLGSYSFANDAAATAERLRSTLATGMRGASFYAIGLNSMMGLRNGIIAGRSGVIDAMRDAANAAVAAAKETLYVNFPSGALLRSKEQARTIANAAKYLTGSAQNSVSAGAVNDNRKTYSDSSSVNVSGNTFYVRDRQDVQSLAVEIAGLIKRQQHGTGVRMA